MHAYERDHPGRPWVGVLRGPPEVTGDDMVAAMDAVGVDGALLVSPFSMYRYDASYALEVHAAHPGRFGLIKPVDPTDPGVADGLAHYVPAAWQDTILLQTVMVFTGISLAWIYERRGTLVADIAAHMAFNAVGIVLILAVH